MVDDRFSRVMFEPGQLVVFLFEKGGGTVVSQENKLIKVLDDDGFIRTFSSNEIAPKIGDLRINDHVVLKDQKSIKRKTNEQTKDPGDRIDLHASELFADESAYSAGEIRQRQLSVFKAFMKKSLELKRRNLLIIHGVGEGVLREDVRSYLNGIEGAEYWDEQYQLNGAGATRVRIRYKD